MLPAPVGEAMAELAEGGPQMLVERLTEAAADPKMLEFMAGLMQSIMDTVSVPGAERAPDDLSSLDE
jgi:hypothetical protein